MKRTKWMALFCASVTACSMSVSAAPFDPAYYAEHNQDVAEAVGYDAEKLAQHYYRYGITEGRAGNEEDAAKKDKPKLVSFEEFDAEYYAKLNQDVVEEYGTDKLSLYMHYADHGAAEGRMPSEKAAEEAKKEAERKAKEEAEQKARLAASVKKSKRKKSKSKSKPKTEDVKESIDIKDPVDTKDPEDSTENVTHTLSYKDNGDRTHDVVCSVADCSEHNKTNVDCTLTYVYVDNTYHDESCSLCGYHNPKDGHMWEGGVCKWCKYER